MKDYIPACKAYDVRGEYPTLIDETLAYTLGIGIARYMKENNPNTPNPSILIGSDVRIPNKKLITAFITGLHKEKITNIQVARDEHIQNTMNEEEKTQYPYGLCSTPMLYYLAHNEIDLAVAFTASHNPPEDVGMKFFDKDCTFLSQACVRDIVTKISQEDPILDNLPEYYDIPNYAKLDEKLTTLQNWLQEKYATLKNNPKIAIDFST